MSLCIYHLRLWWFRGATGTQKHKTTLWVPPRDSKAVNPEGSPWPTGHTGTRGPEACHSKRQFADTVSHNVTFDNVCEYCVGDISLCMWHWWCTYRYFCDVTTRDLCDLCELTSVNDARKIHQWYHVTCVVKDIVNILRASGIEIRPHWIGRDFLAYTPRNTQMSKSKSAHYSKIIADHSGDHRSLWKAFNQIWHICPDHSSIAAWAKSFS